MNRRICSSVLAAFLILALLAVPVAGAQPRVPETVGGAPPPAASQPTSGPHPENGGLLYKTSLDIGDAGFSVYNPATDTWTALTPYETGAQMAVNASGLVHAYGYSTGSIDVYDPATDTWSAIIPAPPGSSGMYGNLEITNDDEFLYTEPWGNTLWYTVNGAWNTMALPFNCDAMGDYDPTTDQYVVGEAWTTNAHWIDVHTWTITNYASGVGNGEYARFSVVMDNMYFFEAGGSNIHYFDLGNPANPPVDTGTYLSWYGSAAADRANGLIYVASLSGEQLWVYDPATNNAMALTGGSYGYHSSLAFAGGGPVQTMTCGWIAGWGRFDPYGRRVIKWKVAVVDEAGSPLGGVAVTADLTWPAGGPVTRTRISNYSAGVANFHWGSGPAGTWTIDVTGMVKTGYTFVDGPQCYAEGYFK